MPTLRSSLRLRITLTGLVLVMLVLMQSLGVLHRVVHGDAVEFEGAAAQAASADQIGEEDVGWRLLFAGHDHHGCDAYDELTHADLAWTTPAMPHPALASQAPAGHHRAWHLAHQAAGFLARGPPIPS